MPTSEDRRWTSGHRRAAIGFCAIGWDDGDHSTGRGGHRRRARASQLRVLVNPVGGALEHAEAVVGGPPPDAR